MSVEDPPARNGSGPAWRKSSHSTEEGDCVETARLAPDAIGLRDSKLEVSPVLTTDRRAWSALLRAIK